MITNRLTLIVKLSDGLSGFFTLRIVALTLKADVIDVQGNGIDNADGITPMITMNRELQETAAELARHLRHRSKEICALNGCTEDEHKCESYAYIRFDMQLLDICASDYFQGCSSPHAAISLPWDGGAEDLMTEVADQCADME